MRYNKNYYTEEEIEIMNDTIEKHLNKLSEKNIIRFGFREKLEELELQNNQTTSDFQNGISEDLEQ